MARISLHRGQQPRHHRQGQVLPQRGRPADADLEGPATPGLATFRSRALAKAGVHPLGIRARVGGRQWRKAMRYRCCLIAIAVVLSMTGSGAGALEELSKYPDLKGQWHRVSPNRWESATNKAPLTPEYRKVYEANQADMAAG